MSRDSIIAPSGVTKRMLDSLEESARTLKELQSILEENTMVS